MENTLTRFENGVEKITTAAKYGDLGCIIYWMSFLPLDQLHADIIKYAAQNGHLECLKYLHENGCPWDEDTTRNAAGGGHLECLKYLHKNGCPCDAVAISWAAGSGYLECLKYLHVNECPWNSQATSWAAGGGHLECLKYLHVNGCPHHVTTSSAAMHGHLECIKYLHENGFRFRENDTAWVAGGGHLECLKYLHVNGHPWDEDATRCAANGGHWECLKYLHENGCPWDKNATKCAAEKGSLECLKYLHENGCPWDKDLVINIRNMLNLKCLKYIVRNEIAWNKDSFRKWLEEDQPYKSAQLIEMLEEEHETIISTRFSDLVDQITSVIYETPVNDNRPPAEPPPHPGNLSSGKRKRDDSDENKVGEENEKDCVSVWETKEGQWYLRTAQLTEFDSLKVKAGKFYFIHAKKENGGYSFIAQNPYYSEIRMQTADVLRATIAEHAYSGSFLTILMSHLIEEFCRLNSLTISDIRKVLYVSDVSDTSSIFRFTTKKKYCVNLLELSPSEISNIYQLILKYKILQDTPDEYCPLDVQDLQGPHSQACNVSFCPSSENSVF